MPFYGTVTKALPCFFDERFYVMPLAKQQIKNGAKAGAQLFHKALFPDSAAIHFCYRSSFIDKNKHAFGILGYSQLVFCAWFKSELGKLDGAGRVVGRDRGFILSDLSLFVFSNQIGL
jgi:hypothetical protein